MVGMIIHLTGGNGRLIIIAGLLVLIATPVARVVFSIFIFLREGDRLYVAITSAVLLILLFGFAVGATGADLPPIPPLPATSWPAAEVAEPFARDLLMQEPAAELAQALAAQPELMPSVLRNLGTAMMSSDAALVDNLHRYLADIVRAAKTNIASIVILDPLRYLEDTAFRKRMTEFLPETMAGLTRDTARSVLDQLDASASLDFDTFEKIAAAHGVVRRASSVRQSAFTDKLRMPDERVLQTGRSETLSRGGSCGVAQTPHRRPRRRSDSEESSSGCYVCRRPCARVHALAARSVHSRAARKKRRVRQPA